MPPRGRGFLRQSWWPLRTWFFLSFTPWPSSSQAHMLSQEQARPATPRMLFPQDSLRSLRSVQLALLGSPTLSPFSLIFKGHSPWTQSPHVWTLIGFHFLPTEFLDPMESQRCVWISVSQYPWTWQNGLKALRIFTSSQETDPSIPQRGLEDVVI